MPTGSAILNFGLIGSPTGMAEVNVTGQAGILAASKVEAFRRLAGTAGHSADEHRVEPIKITVGNIIAGTGFTIYGEAFPQSYGQWNVDWVWV